MKKINPSLPTLAIIFALMLSTFSCAPAQNVTASPTPCPATQTPPASFEPTAVPTKLATQTPRPTPLPDYRQRFLDALPTNPESCLPDQTADDLGVYIYDLKDERELVSINADTPLQFASAFKGPVLVYFLSSCRQYWDPSSADWKEHFQNLETARNVDQFVSPEYEQALAEFISNPENWKDIGKFSAEHQQMVNGLGGATDTRYFVLDKVYGMIAQSSNLATADVLNFIFENCPNRPQFQIEAKCGGDNAITTFNAWFNDFSQITYESGTPRRGLYSWDTVVEKGQTITLSTFGQKDQCANQTAILKCDPAYTASNTLTARDFFKFYYALYNLEDERVRETAFSLLKVDEPGPAQGNLKNLARNMHAVAFSKNGHAFFINGSINSDAGIVRYEGKDFIVVTLSFNALGPMATLYGTYDSAGNLVTDPGLIQNLLEEYSISP
jgi:hypothetical protein